MVCKCPNCGTNFDTLRSMQIHKADCLKKDTHPAGTNFQPIKTTIKGRMKKDLL